jgi:TPR repeat protein
VRQREAEAARQADLTRQREADARRQAEAAEQSRAELARLQAESSKKPAQARAPEPAKPAEAAKPAEPPEAKVAEPAKLASAVPAPPDAVAPTPEALLERAVALEADGKNAEAAKLLKRVARGKGQTAGEAAKRLGDLLQKKNVPGVSYDYAEALKYYQIARDNGVEPPTARGR